MCTDLFLVFRDRDLLKFIQSTDYDSNLFLSCVNMQGCSRFDILTLYRVFILIRNTKVSNVYVTSDTFPLVGLLFLFLKLINVNSILVADGFLHNVSCPFIKRCWSRTLGVFFGKCTYGTGFIDIVIVFTELDKNIISQRFFGLVKVVEPRFYSEPARKSTFLSYADKPLSRAVFFIFTSSDSKLTFDFQCQLFDSILRSLSSRDVPFFGVCHPDDFNKVNSINPDFKFNFYSPNFSSFDLPFERPLFIGFHGFTSYDFYGLYDAYISVDRFNSFLYPCSKPSSSNTYEEFMLIFNETYEQWLIDPDTIRSNYYSFFPNSHYLHNF